ncbi:MAG: alpha/beta hydrolase [Burkholderiaceae bacterium]
MSDAEVAARWGAKLETQSLGEVDLRFASAGSGPLVILVHGFPESWYSWRHQFGPLAEAGYRVVAPDVRGYGGSSRPGAVEAYDLEHLTGDMRALADHLSPREPAVIVGHDWGAPIAWHTAWLHPQRFRAVAGLSVPHVAPGELPGIEVFKRVFTDKGRFFYMVYFQDEGVAEAELEADPPRSLRLFYSALGGDAPKGTWPTDKPHGARLFDGMVEPAMPRSWFDADDLAYYTSQFERSGFRGPLNRYRNFARDHAWLRAQGDAIVRQPSLYVIGDRDLVKPMYPAGPVESMRPFVTDLRGAHELTDCGHWTQQERPAEVNRLLINWLASLP